MMSPCASAFLIRQRGAALFIVLLLIVVGAGIALVGSLKTSRVELDAQRKTAAALAEAKQALLGYAVSDPNRPGSLPCADVNNDGDTTVGVDSSCSPQVIGRLPWKQLGLQDLRDGRGERLWYAVSPDFRAFLSPATNPLNSTAPGQITLRSTSGAIVNDAGAIPSTGVVAVIIAPGAVLTRRGSVSPQDRSCSGGGGCAADFICLSPFQSVALCNPVNYMEVAAGLDDNADFIASASNNGFVSGVILDATGAHIVNDQIMPITRSDLYTAITLRMARELSQTAYTGAMGATIASIANKPAAWTANQWDNAVDAGSFVVGSTIVLRFINCNITFKINGPGMMSRSANSC